MNRTFICLQQQVSHSMFAFSWRKWSRQLGLNCCDARRRQGRSPEARGSLQLQIEQLEDRTLLSTYQWTGLGADTNWNTVGNWAQNGVPATTFPKTAGDIAQFIRPIASCFNPNVNVPITVGEIDFNTAASISIQGTSPLTLD